MSTITALRRAKKDSGATSDCYCIRLELNDGTTLRFTDNQEDLTTSLKNSNGTEIAISPVTYTSYGFDTSAVGGNEQGASEVDLEGILLPLGYTKEQIAAGLFDQARIYVFITDFTRPVEDEEKMFTGFWGEATIIDGRYVTKFRSLLEVFEIDTSRVVSQLCDAGLGSTRCGVKMEAQLRENFGGFDPSTLPLKLWWDFSDPDNYTDNGTYVTAVTDLSGNGVTVVSQATNPLIGETIGSQDAIDFSGSRFFKLSSNITNIEEAEMYAVVKSPALSGGYCLAEVIFGSSLYPIPEFQDGDATTTLGNTVQDVYLDGDPEPGQITSQDNGFDQVNSSTYIIRVDFSSTAFQLRSIGVGGSGATVGPLYLESVLAELYVTEKLTPTQRYELNNYLGSKYSISVPSSDQFNDVVSTTDARTRAVVYDTDPAYDHLWFEQQTAGALGGSTPVWNTTIGGETTDGDVTWKTVPARVTTLTTTTGQGQNQTVVMNESLPTGFEDVYQDGKLKFTDGPLSGQEYVIITHTLNTFTINMPTIGQTTAGNTAEITRSCDKTLNECDVTFNNSKNFQGFPYLPGQTNIVKFGKK